MIGLKSTRRSTASVGPLSSGAGVRAQQAGVDVSDEQPRFRGLSRIRRAIASQWRRSLQFRVLVSTVGLGLIMTSLIGGYLYQTIAQGLANDRTAAAQEQSRGLTTLAQGLFDGMTPNAKPADLNAQVSQLVRQNLRTVGTDTARYTVFVRALGNERPDVLDTVITGDITLAEVPNEMRTQVSKDPGHLQTAIVTLTSGAADAANSGAKRDVPAVIVGSQVSVPTAGPYDLYFVYPMEQEQRSLRVIARSMLLGGGLITLLLAGVAALVARQVVAPVRRAAAVAERLSSGHLNERMRVDGRDDLAALGTSFNAMADNLQRQIRQLEGLSRLQQRFVSDVSHELRTPLTTVRMASAVIHDARGDFDPVVARSSELMHGQLDRFEELLGDLLEISRFDAGAAVLEPTETDLASLCLNVIEASEQLAERRDCEVRLHRPADPVVVDVDSRRIERILRNLIVNAIEHSEGQPVDVHVAQGEDASSVLVIDRGVGLRTGEASMVFNRFWRADPARARNTGGTGLGLAISLEDARLHGGWLQAWGEPGLGSRFRLTVPNSSGGSITSSPLPLTPLEEQATLPSEEL